MASVVPLDISIQAIGTPSPEGQRSSPAPRKQILLTVAPHVPSDDREKKHVPEMSYIVRGVDADEAAVPEAPERVHLEGSLHTQNKGVPLQSRSRRRRCEFIFVKYTGFHLLQSIYPKFDGDSIFRVQTNCFLLHSATHPA